MTRQVAQGRKEGLTIFICFSTLNQFTTAKMLPSWLSAVGTSGATSAGMGSVRPVKPTQATEVPAPPSKPRPTMGPRYV